MNKVRGIALLALLLAVFSCKQPDVKVEANPMLSTVPSDALALATYSRLSDLLAMLDSTDVFNSIAYGRLQGSQAALSYCYTSSLTPVLTINAGRHGADSTSAASAVMERAERLKLYAKILPTQMKGHSTDILVLSPSETLVGSVERHLREGASIFDAPSFTLALEKSSDSADAIYLKNSGALRWLPKNALSGAFTNREAASFIKALCEWIVLIPSHGSGFELRLAGSDSPTEYARLLETDSKDALKIQEIAPDNSELVISEAAGPDGYRKLYEEYLDASVKLDKYNNSVSSLRKQIGRSPLDVEKELGVKEVSLLRWEGHKVSLLRCSSNIKDTLIVENEFKGLVGALYGSAFRTEDSWTCKRGYWRAFGSKEDVEAFSVLETKEHPQKLSSFYFRNASAEIYQESKGPKIWKSSL